MTNEQIIKEIEESIRLINQTKTTVNDALCHARNILEQKTDLEDAHAAYNKGLEDGRNEAWELARRITGAKCDGGLRGHLTKVFETSITRVVFKYNTYREALAKIEAYDEELKEIKVGDEITVIGNAKKGYVIDKSKKYEDYYVVLITNCGNLYTAIYNKTVIEKTGKHIDIQNILN